MHLYSMGICTVYRKIFMVEEFHTFLKNIIHEILKLFRHGMQECTIRENFILKKRSDSQNPQKFPSIWYNNQAFKIQVITITNLQ